MENVVKEVVDAFWRVFHRTKKASLIFSNVGAVYVKGETVRGTFQSSLIDQIDFILNKKKGTFQFFFGNYFDYFDISIVLNINNYNINNTIETQTKKRQKWWLIQGWPSPTLQFQMQFKQWTWRNLRKKS